MAKQVSKKKIVHFPEYDMLLAQMFEHRGYKVDCEEHGFWNADAVVFTGGADVCPMLYGEQMLPTTNVSLERDRRDNSVYRNLWNDMPKIGVCRGAQFLNVMNGGWLFQDVDNHTSNHRVIDHQSGRLIDVTSTHHQMMQPSMGDRIEILSSGQASTVKQSAEYTLEKAKGKWPDWHDPEAIFYQDTNSLCVQFHPEYTHNASECRKYFWELIDRTLGDQI